MKASGFNAVCAYFNWSYHSPAQGVYDFIGVRDMDLFCDMAAEAGLYVLACPGPYINGELNAGGGAPWNGAGYSYERNLDNSAYERRFYLTNIANGIKIHNIYMVFGGTSWGWLPAPVVYTSYDYGAAISEPCQLTDKIGGLKQIGYFLQAVPDVTKIDPAAPVTVSNSALTAYHLANPDTGTELYLIRNDHSVALSGTFPLGAYTVPQSGPLTVASRDAKLVLAGYTLAGTPLVYTTSHLMTRAGGVAMLTGPAGDSGEIVLNYPERPVVTGATATYDATTGDLLVSYTHDGLTAVTVTLASGDPLVLLVADDDTAGTIWRYDIPGAGAVIVAGPALLRRAEIAGHALFLSGDTSGPVGIHVWAPPGVREMLWNGRLLRTAPGTGGALAARLDGPPPVELPAGVAGRRLPRVQPAADAVVVPVHHRAVVGDRHVRRARRGTGRRPPCARRAGPDDEPPGGRRRQRRIQGRPRAGGGDIPGGDRPCRRVEDPGRGPHARRQAARAAQQRWPVRGTERVVPARIPRRGLGAGHAAERLGARRGGVVPHHVPAGRPGRRGRVDRPVGQRRPGEAVPCADLPERLERRAVRQRGGPADHVRPAEWHPAHPRRQHASARGHGRGRMRPGRGHPGEPRHGRRRSDAVAAGRAPTDRRHDPFGMMGFMSSGRRAVVIGSGIGGLAAAAAPPMAETWGRPCLRLAPALPGR
jgi:hypothetical protein